MAAALRGWPWFPPLLPFPAPAAAALMALLLVRDVRDAASAANPETAVRCAIRICVVLCCASRHNKTTNFNCNLSSCCTAAARREPLRAAVDERGTWGDVALRVHGAQAAREKKRTTAHLALSSLSAC